MLVYQRVYIYICTYGYYIFLLSLIVASAAALLGSVNTKSCEMKINPRHNPCQWCVRRMTLAWIGTIGQMLRGGKGKSSAASQLAKAARIAEEMALQKAGAYSLRVVVRQAPVSSFPTALCWGSSLRTLYLCRKDIIAGKFTHMSSVGLGDLEPMRPCANFNLCTPGSICSTWTIGSFQIEAAPSKSVGSAGCSSMPTLPANAVSRSAFKRET